MIPEHRYVTLVETASILSVSSATVRNWIRHDYLRPSVRGRGLLFSYDEVSDLRERIRSGSLPRLIRRANKAGANKSFIPDEYLRDRECMGKLEDAVERISAAGIDHERAIFMLSLSHACRRLEGDGGDPRRIVREGFRIPGKRHLGREMEAWYADLGRFALAGEHQDLFSIELPEQRDALGLVYQSLLGEGRKARGGSYYTPAEIVDAIARGMTGADSAKRILDPCCGTGQFLMAFAKRTGDPERLYGYDVDRIAVRIARINLMLEFSGHDFDPRIYHADFMMDEALPVNDGFDLVATNPPWGMHYSQDERARIRSLFPEIRSHESFSCMLKKSIDALTDGGGLSFILPESILHVRAHADIRDYILRTTRVERIIRLGRVFKNVFTPVIRLDLQKGGRPGRVWHDSGSGVRSVRQKRFSENADRVFDVNIDPADSEIFNRVFGHRHVTLKGRAEWALGIVTGDNERYLCTGKRGRGYEPIWKGRDVDHYFLREPGSFIRFDPGQFQQSAPEWKYRAREKLIYRFISKRLVVAYDDGGRLTLNSANIIFPKQGEYPIRAVLALFNSSLYQFLLQKKFSSIKVLRSHLEYLPLPLWKGNGVEGLERLAGRVLAGFAGLSEVDDYIMRGFGLSDSEMTHILRSRG